MNNFGKIGIFLLLILVCFISINASDGNVTITLSEATSTKTATLNETFADNNDSDYYEEEEDDIIHVCGDENDNRGLQNDSLCTCEYGNLKCNFLEHVNIKIMNKTIQIKRIELYFGNISKLNLKNLLPEKQSFIESLNFYESNITSIQTETFDNFTALKTLGLAKNVLTKIDETILTEQIGSTLAELDLSSNSLTSLSSSSFKYLKKLKTLKLRKNPKISVSSELFSAALASLEFLDLSFCNISNLEDDVFINLGNLTELILSHNPLSSLPSTAINPLLNLQTLHIDDTEITVLKNKNLKLNKNLKSFFAVSTKLQRIEDCAFCSFPNLTEVDLNNNGELSFIHENAFGLARNFRISFLERFLILGCNLTTLPENLLNWTALKRFSASRNPFICDCSIKWFINFINSKYQSHNLYRCHNSGDLNEKTFFELPDSFCNSTSSIKTSTSISMITVSTGAASTNSLNEHWSFTLLILSLIFISLLIFVAGIYYYYRNQKVLQIQDNKYGEDFLEKDFDL